MRRLGRLRWVGLLALLPVLGLLLSAGAGAATPIAVVAPGQAFTVDVGGFAARTPVTVQLVGSRTGRDATRATARGRVHLAYRAPSKAGRYRLLVVGAVRTGSGRRSVPPVGTGGGDPQAVMVTVPLVIGVPFRVGGAGIGSGGLHNGSGSGPSGSGGLATTGTDLESLLILAAVLGLLGLVATLCGRGRARA